MSSQTYSNDLPMKEIEQELTERVANVDLQDDTASTVYSDTASTLRGDDDDFVDRALFDRVACTLYVDDDAYDTVSTVYDGASVVDDDTLYDGASTLHDTASTLYDDDTSTLVGDNKKEKKPKRGVSEVTKDDLPNLRVIVSGLNVKNRGSKEVIYVTLSVRRLLRRDYEDIINNRDVELWKIEKCYTDFLKLDTILRELGYVREHQPPFEKSLFLSHNPEKVIIRRAKIDQYFRILFSVLPLKDASSLCEFLNSGIVPYQKNFGNTIKEGYLARKEGMFNNTWKSRYCVLKGTTFQIYETNAGGSPIDSIPLQRGMFATLKFNQAFHPLQYGFSIMQFKKDRPGFPVYTHHEFWPTSNKEEKERDDWEKKLGNAFKVIQTQHDSVAKAKGDIQEEKYLKAVSEYQRMRKAQATQAKQKQQSSMNGNSSLLKKLSEKR